MKKSTRTSAAVIAVLVVLGGCSTGARDASEPNPEPAAVNQAPIASAGSDFTVDVNSGPVALDGFASSDPEGKPVTFQWSVGGSSVTLKGEKTATPTFEPSVAGNVEFTLTVSDGEKSATDTVVVKVNGPPVANAGADQRINVGSPQARLSAAATADPNTDEMTFAWEIIAPADHGNSVLTAPDAVNTELSLDTAIAGPYTLRLTVNDGRLSHVDELEIRLNTPPQITAARVIDDKGVVLAPRVHQLPPSFTPVKLEALASDADNDPSLTFAWTVVTTPANVNVTLSNANTARPSFTPVALGKYLFRIAADDGAGNSSQEFEVEIFNTAPLADAGQDNKVNIGVNIEVPLSAVKSADPDGDTLTFQWRLVTAPPGSNVGTTFGNPTVVTPSFTPDKFGFYQFALIASDGTAQHEAQVQIGVINPSFLVSADADRNTTDVDRTFDVSKGGMVNLGAAMTTDVTGQTLEVQWKQVTINGQVANPNPNVINFSFAAPNEVTTLIFKIEVRNLASSSFDEDVVQINVLEDATKAVFVSENTGIDGSGRGSKGSPFKTLQAAINRADQMVGADVYATNGSYNESVVLKTGVSIYGGYDDGGVNLPTWKRDIVSFKTIITGGTTAVNGLAVGDLTLDGLEIESANATIAGASSIGLKLRDSTNVTITRNTIRAGKGANGADGVAPAIAVSGGAGGIGQSVCLPYAFNAASKSICGRIDTVTRCPLPLRTTGGVGGISLNGNGGVGGIGANGLSGATAGANAINGGAGGLPGNTLLPPKSLVGRGGISMTAASGVNGQAGATLGAFSSLIYSGSGGANGSDGASTPGGGGGGGGGVGGIMSFSVLNVAIPEKCDLVGGYGGGGSGASAGGQHGTAGSGGGGSFGIYFGNVSGSTVTGNTITTAAGGAGGKGSDGATGGIGSSGRGGAGLASGTTTVLDGTTKVTAKWTDVGAGGAGGVASGGRGGHGGGGGGGPSIGIVVDSAAVNALGTNTITTPAQAPASEQCSVVGQGGGGPGAKGANGICKPIHGF